MKAPRSLHGYGIAWSLKGNLGCFKRMNSIDKNVSAVFELISCYSTDVPYGVLCFTYGFVSSIKSCINYQPLTSDVEMQEFRPAKFLASLRSKCEGVHINSYKCISIMKYSHEHNLSSNSTDIITERSAFITYDGCREAFRGCGACNACCDRSGGYDIGTGHGGGLGINIVTTIFSTIPWIHVGICIVHLILCC